MANTTMANNSCPVEAAMRECPLMAELPQIPIEVFWGLHIAAQSAQTKDPAQESTTDKQAELTAETEDDMNDLLGQLASVFLRFDYGPKMKTYVPCRKKQTQELTPEASADDTSDEDPELEPTAEVTIAEPDSAHRELPSQQQPYPEKFNCPPQGQFVFVEPDKVKTEMDECIASLESADHPDLVRGKVREICEIALAMNAEELVDLCEDFAVGDTTRAQILAAARAALGEYYAEHRKYILRNGFEAFCKEYLTTFKEIAEIIG